MKLFWQGEQKYKRTLHDYKDYIKPTGGFNPDVISDIGKKTDSLSEIERYVGMLAGQV